MGLAYIVAATWVVVALAADTEIVLSETRLIPPKEAGVTSFGFTSSVGDFDGDGRADLVTSAQNQVYVYYGSSPSSLSLTPQVFEAAVGTEDWRVGAFGFAVVSGDINGDGADELIVSAPEYHGGVYIYTGGPSGLTRASQYLLYPPEIDVNYEGFGTGLGSLGDMDGDGAVEIGIGAPDWTGDAKPGEQIPGAVFLYSAWEGRLDACDGLRLDPLSSASKEADLLGFGFRVAGVGDTNGDGYDDVGVTCPLCSPPECAGCGQVIVWLGGAPMTFADADAHVMFLDDPAWPGTQWNAFGWTVGAAGDINADGFGDIIVGALGGPTILFGGAAGPEEASIQSLRDVDGLWATGIGDFDADGYDDVGASGGEWAGSLGGPGTVHILFGDIDGISSDRQLQLTATSEQDGFGNSVMGVGDVTGDGRPDLAVGADYEGGGVGAMYVYSSLCTWYRDSDGDGYGDPDVTLADCHEQPGYAPRPDDCDDTDAAVHGAFWYPDADGDGYGLHDGGALACVGPAHVAAVPFDCDDTDAERNPEATDETVDGIDQNCDEHDGAWVYDTGDCSEDTGDTGESGDTGATEESGGNADTSDTAAISGTGSEPPAGEHDCGCAAASGVGVGASMGGGLLLVAGALLGGRSRGSSRR